MGAIDQYQKAKIITGNYITTITFIITSTYINTRN